MSRLTELNASSVIPLPNTLNWTKSDLQLIVCALFFVLCLGDSTVIKRITCLSETDGAL